MQGPLEGHSPCAGALGCPAGDGICGNRRAHGMWGCFATPCFCSGSQASNCSLADKQTLPQYIFATSNSLNHINPVLASGYIGSGPTSGFLEGLLPDLLLTPWKSVGRHPGL